MDLVQAIAEAKKEYPDLIVNCVGENEELFLFSCQGRGSYGAFYMTIDKSTKQKKQFSITNSPKNILGTLK